MLTVKSCWNGVIFWSTTKCGTSVMYHSLNLWSEVWKCYILYIVATAWLSGTLVTDKLTLVHTVPFSKIAWKLCELNFMAVGVKSVYTSHAWVRLCGIKFYYLDKHFMMAITLCRLWAHCTKCHNLVVSYMVLQQCRKISIIMGIYVATVYIQILLFMHILILIKFIRILKSPHFAQQKNKYEAIGTIPWRVIYNLMQKHLRCKKGAAK